MFLRHILSTFATVSLLGRAYAGCSDSVYANLTITLQSNGCIPSGYFQVHAFNQLTSAGVVSFCELQCSLQGSKCQAYVGGILRTAETGLNSGQCFLYLSPPTGSIQCAQSTAEVIGGFRNSVQDCFSSSTAVASAYCSSILSIPTITVKVTSTPRSTLTRTQTTVLSQTYIYCQQLRRRTISPTAIGRRGLLPVSPIPSCLIGNLLAPLIASSACSCLLPSPIITKTITASQSSLVTETVTATSTSFVGYANPGNFASFDIQVVDSEGSSYYMNVQTDQVSTFGLIDPTDPMLANVSDPPKFIEYQNTIVLYGNLAEEDKQGRFAFSAQPTLSSLQCTALENANDEILCTLGGTAVYFELAPTASGESQRAVLITPVAPTAITQVHLFAANAFSCQK